MTHEFRDLINTAYQWQHRGIESVLATLVALDGSSYRRPGVRMLINDRGEMRGAVSGGCVEKEVLRQAQSVFSDGIPKMMTYDGRLRLGCEGILYILLEPVTFSEELYNALHSVFQDRKLFSCEVYFKNEVTSHTGMGTVLQLQGNSYSLHPSFSITQTDTFETFSQSFPPIFQLYIFGAEHDAVQLSQMAYQLGWDVHIIAPPDEQKSIDYFRGARTLSSPLLDKIDTSGIDVHTALVLMSHSLNKDLAYLIALKDVNPAYFGMLGPKKRRERLFSELLKSCPETPYEFFESIHGPAGLSIGAEGASEIALSILAEVLSVIRKAEIIPLSSKSGGIHD